MNTKATLKTTTAHGGPVILCAGVAMLAVAIATPGHSQSEVAAPRPGPTVTVTRSAAAPVTGHTSTPAPGGTQSSASARPTPEAAVIAAAQRTPSRRTIPPTGRRPGAGAPSGPSPTPAPASPTAACSGSVLALQVLRAACVSVGGSR